MDILNLQSLKVVELKENEHGDYQIKVEAVAPPPACHHCGCIANIQRFGTRQQLYMDTPMHGKRVGLMVDRQRYRCKDCGTVFIEPLPDMDDKRLATKRLVEYIEKQSLKRTFVSISDEVGVNEKTVRNIFRDYVNHLEETVRFETPRCLGIDEIHILHKPRCVLANIEENTIIDMLENRNKDTVIRYLQRLPNKDNIQYVSMDMWNPYRDAVKAVLPNAKIVIDKFHVVRMANNALEEIRKSFRAEMEPKQRRRLMNDRYVLLKREHDLDARGQLLLEIWTAQFPRLRQAYDLKEAFFKIWDIDNFLEAYNAYDQWKKSIPPEMEKAFKPILTALTNWEEEVFNYFHHPITNAYTESLNSLIRVVNRLGRGYSFDALRAKILFTEGVRKTTRTAYRNQSFPIGRVAVNPLPKIDWEALSSEKDVIPQLGADISTLITLIEDGEL